MQNKAENAHVQTFNSHDKTMKRHVQMQRCHRRYNQSNVCLLAINSITENRWITCMPLVHPEHNFCYFYYKQK